MSLKHGIICCLLSALFVFANVSARAAGHSGDEEKSEKTVSLKKYIPEFSGEIKARFEWRTNGGEARFNVRNARLMANGYVNRFVTYRFFLDFHDQGNINILDAYIVTNLKHFEFVLGQQRADLDRRVNPYFFANRSFLIKYLTSHYAVSDSGYCDAVNIQGWRDIGLQASYRTGTGIPLRFAFGMFNGSGLNRPEWQKRLSYVVRVEAGHKMQGWAFKAWYYDGVFRALERVVMAGEEPVQQTMIEKHRQKVRMAAYGIHYAHKRCYFEGEYGQRWRDGESEGRSMIAAYVQGIYAFPLPADFRLFRYAAPVIRWDYGRDIDFLNISTEKHERFSGHRITTGINLGFIERIMISEFRINFEKFLFGKRPSDVNVNPLVQDKLTVELCLQF